MPTTPKKKTSEEILAELRAKVGTPTTANDFSTQLSYLNQASQAATSKAQQPRAAQPAPTPQRQTTIAKPGANNFITQLDMLRAKSASAGKKQNPWEVEPLKGWVSPEPIQRNAALQVGPTARVPVEGPPKSSTEQLVQLRNQVLDAQTGITMPVSIDRPNTGVPGIGMTGTVSGGQTLTQPSVSLELTDEQRLAALGSPREWLDRKMNPVDAISEQWDATSEYYEPTIQQAQERYAAEKELSVWDDPVGFYKNTVEGFVSGLATAGQMLGDLAGQIPKPDTSATEAYLDENAALRPTGSLSATAEEATPAGLQPVPEFTDTTDYGNEPVTITKDAMLATSAAATVMGAGLNVAASGTHAVSAVFPVMGSVMADVRYGVMRGALWLSEADDAILSTPNPNPFDKAAEYELRRSALGKPLDAAEKADLYFHASQYARKAGLNLDNMSLYDLFGMGPYTMGQIIEANARKSGEQKVNISDIIHQATIKYKTNFSADVVQHLDDLAGQLINLQGDDAESVAARAEIREEIDYIYKVGSRSNLMLNPDERLKFQTEQVLTIETDVAEQKAKAVQMALAANQKMMNARTEQDVRDAEALSYKAAEIWYDADMKEKMPWQSQIDAYNFNNPWALAAMLIAPSIADSLDLVEAGLHLKPWQRRVTKTMDEFGIDEIVTAAPHAIGDTLGVLEVESIAKVVSDLESWNSNLQEVTNKIANKASDRTKWEQIKQSGHSMAIRDAYAATRPLVAVLTDVNNKNDIVRIVDALLTDPQAAIRDGIKGPWTDARLAQYAENGVLRIPVGTLNAEKVQDALLTVAAIWPEFKRNSIVLGSGSQIVDKQTFLHELFNATVQGGVRRYGVANEWSYAPYGTAKGVLSPLGDGRAVVKYVDIDGDVLGTSNIMMLTEAKDEIKKITELAKNNRFYVRSPMADAGAKMRGLVSPFYIFTNPSNYVLNVVNQVLYAFSDGINPLFQREGLNPFSTKSGGVLSKASRDEHLASLFGTTEVTGRQVAGSDAFTQFLAGTSGVVLPGSGSGPKPNALQRVFTKLQFVKPWHASQEIAFSETIHYKNMIHALDKYLRKAEGRIVDDLVGMGLSDQEARALARNVHEDVYTNGTKNINQVVSDFLEGKATGIDISEIDPNWNNYLTPQHRAKLLEGWRNATSPQQVMAVTKSVMQDVRSYWQQLVANEINMPGRVSFTQADEIDDLTTFQQWMQRGKRMGYEGADEAVKVYKQGMAALAAANKQLVDEAMKVFENDSAAVSSFISEYWYGMQRRRTDIRQRLGELVTEIYEENDSNLWKEKYFPEQEKLWAEYYANGVQVAQQALENVRNKAYQAGSGLLDDLFQAAGETSVETLTGRLQNLEPGLGKGSSMPEFLRTGRQIEDAATAQFFATAQQLNIRPDVMMDIVQSAMQDVSTEGARIRAWLDRTRIEIDKAKKADQTKLWDEFAIKRNAAYRELYGNYIPGRWFAASQQLAAETLDLTGKTLEQAQAETQRVAAQALMAQRLKGNLSPVERAAIENRIRQALGEVGLPSVTKKGKPFDNAIINALRKDFKERFGYELPKNVKNLKDLTPEQLVVAEELSKIHAYNRTLRQAAQQGHIRQSVLDYAAKLAPVMRLDEGGQEAMAWVLEARARAWAEQTGKNADDYIVETFADPVAGGQAGVDALYEYLDYNTPQWRAFFDGSQVTNGLSVRGNNRPSDQLMIMFHGSPSAGDIDAFDPNRFDPDGLYGPGIYLTEATDVASGKPISGISLDGVPMDGNSPGFVKFEVMDGPGGWLEAIDKIADGIDNGEIRMSSDQHVRMMKRMLADGDTLGKVFRRNAWDYINGAEPGFDNFLEAIGRAGSDAAVATAVFDDASTGVGILKNAGYTGLSGMINAGGYSTASGGTLPLFVNAKNLFRIDQEMSQSDAYRLYHYIIQSAYDDGVLTQADNYIPYDSVHFDASNFWQDPVAGLANSGTVSGEYLYQTLNDFLGDDKALTNRALQAAGYDGITHVGGVIMGNVLGMDEHRVVIAFEPNQVKSIYNLNPTADPRLLKEMLDGGITRGAVEFTEDGKAILRGLEAPDLVTAFHEYGHVIRRDLYRTAAANPALKGDIAITEKWAGVVDGVWTVEAEEKFAKGFEKWLASGKAPIPELETVFQRLKRWMLDIYKTLTGKDRVSVSKEMRGVFERMLSSEVVTPEVEAAIKAQAQQGEDFIAGLKIGGDGVVGGAPLPKVVLNADQSRKAMGMGVAPGIMYGARESLARIDDFERQANLRAADIIAGRGPVNQAAATQAQQYFRNMRATYNNILSAANRYGEKMGSFAMIDYDNLNRIDEVAGLVMPYFTWYGRSFKNAAERMIFEPAFFQHLFRIEEKLARQQAAQGDPSRFEGSLPIDTPWGKWYIRLNPSRYYMLLPYAINNRFSRPGDVETPFAMFAEGMNASGLGVYWWIDSAAGAAEAYSKKAEWDATPEAMRVGPDPVEDYWRKEGRILDFSMQTRGLQELLAYTQGVNIFTFMDLPPGLVNQVRKPWFENNVGRSINNMQTKGEITVTEATLARQLIKDFVTGNTPYPEMKRYLEENPNVTKIVNLAIQDSMGRDLIRTGSGLLTGGAISPFDETENEWLAAQQKQYGMRYDSETNPLGGPTAVEQFYRSPEGDLAQAANQKSSMYADVSKPDPILSLMRSDMYDRSRSASDQLQAAWQKGEVEAVQGADIYMLPVDRMAVARAEARKEAVSMYGEEWVANFEAQAGEDWYISDLTAAASAEEGKAFQSLPEAATLGQQKPVSDPVTAPIADILREMSVQNYGDMNPMEREVAVTQDIIEYARKLPGQPNFEEYLKTKDKDENWWTKYLADTDAYKAKQEDYLMEKLGMSREEARAEMERQANIYKSPEQLEYERVQDILTEAERFPGKPVYSDSMSKSQKKAWYQKNELWKRERTTWLAEQLGISYSEAEKILKTRAERKQELYYPDEEKSSSSSGRSNYRGSSWSAYSRRSYGRSYGGRSYSSRSYGGGSGYYGRSGGSASGETDLLPSIEDYVRYVKRLTGALWNTPKPRYVRS